MVAGRLGLVLPACLGVVLGACGHRSSSLSPTIRSIDRTLPASAVGRDFPFARNGCIEVPLGPGVGTRRSCRLTPAQRDGLPRSPRTPVHLVAELSLARPQSLSQHAFFADFESRGLGTCFTIIFAIALDPPTCDGNRRCAALCVRYFSEGRTSQLGGRATGRYTLVAGTVPSNAKNVRLVFSDGKSLTYALRGPLAKDFPGRRIFIADLGRRPKPARVGVVP